MNKENILNNSHSQLLVANELYEEQSKLNKGFKIWSQLKDKRLGLSSSNLEAAYNHEIEKMNCRYPKSIERTLRERVLAKKIKEHTKLDFVQSVWIGCFNFDLFLNQLGEKGTSSMKGLVIEVDGNIHDRQHKMSKDQLRYKMLHELKIAVHCVDNSEINNVTESNFVENIKNLRRLDSRGRKRLMKKIHLFTLCCCLCKKEISAALCVPEEKLFRSRFLGKNGDSNGN